MKFLGNINFNNIKGLPFQGVISKKQENKQKHQENQFNFFKNPQKDAFVPSFKRLNDTDTNLINNNLLKYIPADSLRIELELEQSENKLKDIETDIKVLKFLGYDEQNEKFADLNKKKMELSSKISEKRVDYRNLGLMNKVTDSVADVYLRTLQKASDTRTSFLANPFVKKIKAALPALNSQNGMNGEIKETLNNSVMFGNKFSSFLSTTVTPHGEEGQRWAEFAGMMANANKLDAHISKLLAKTKTSGNNIKNIFADGYNFIAEKLGVSIAKLKTLVPKPAKHENIFAVKNDKNIS